MVLIQLTVALTYEYIPIAEYVHCSHNLQNIKIKFRDRVSTGLKQGYALSPVLFNLVLEKIVRELNTIDGVAMGNTNTGFTSICR